MNNYRQLDATEGIEITPGSLSDDSLPSISDNEPRQYSKTHIISTHLAMLLMMLLLSLNYIGVRNYIIDGNTGFSFGLLRTLFSSTFIPLFYLFGATNPHQMQYEENVNVLGSRIPTQSLLPLACVVIAGTIRQIAIPISMMVTSVSNVGLVQPITPIATTVFAIILKSERIDFTIIISVILSIVGLIISEKVWDDFRLDAGLIILLFIPMTKGIQIVGTQLSRGLSPIEIHRFQIIGLSILVIPSFFLIELFIFCDGSLATFLDNIQHLKGIDIGAVIFSALAVIIVSWRLQIHGIKTLGSISVSLYQCFQPIFVFILASTLLNEKIHIHKIVGSAIICFALIVNQIGKMYQQSLPRSRAFQQDMSPTSESLLRRYDN